MHLVLDVHREADGHWVAAASGLPGVVAHADSIDAVIAAAESLALARIAAHGDECEMLTLSVRTSAVPAEAARPIVQPALRREIPPRHNSRGRPRRKPAGPRVSRRAGRRSSPP